MSIPIFCINLERAVERKEKITKLWIQELGFDITFWRAWDRREIENGNFYFPYDAELTQKTIKKQLSSGEIACSTSHCMVYEHAVKNNLEHCIVMEDDILPTNFTRSMQKKELEEFISNFAKQMPECDIFLLFEHYNKLKDQTPIKETTDLLMYKKLSWGNQMIYLNKSGIKKMYDNLNKICYLADHWNLFPFSKPEKDIAVVKNALGRHEFEQSADISTYIGTIPWPFLK